MEYVYEKEMEPAYRVSLLKSFNKTLDNGYFPMVIIDAVNDKVWHVNTFSYLTNQLRSFIITFPVVRSIFLCHINPNF